MSDSAENTQTKSPSLHFYWVKRRLLSIAARASIFWTAFLPLGSVREGGETHSISVYGSPWQISVYTSKLFILECASLSLRHGRSDVQTTLSLYCRFTTCSFFKVCLPNRAGDMALGLWASAENWQHVLLSQSSNLRYFFFSWEKDLQMWNLFHLVLLKLYGIICSI